MKGENNRRETSKREEKGEATGQEGEECCQGGSQDMASTGVAGVSVHHERLTGAGARGGGQVQISCPALP
ncbi:hypothetical protein HHA02_09400 [Cobetia marina]|nr:hypothetical protein HHA02_09400 [Cobetia marina]